MISEKVTKVLESLLDSQNMSEKEKKLFIFFMRNNKSYSISELERYLRITRYYLYELAERLVEKGLINKIPSQPVRYIFDLNNLEFQIALYRKEIMNIEVHKNKIILKNKLLSEMKNYKLFRHLFGIFKQNTFTLNDVITEEFVSIFNFTEKKTRAILNSFVRGKILIKGKIGRKNSFKFKSLNNIIKIREFQTSKILKYNIESLTKLQSKLQEIKEDGLEENEELQIYSDQKEQNVIILNGKQTIKRIQHEFSHSNDLFLARLVHEQSLLTKDKLYKITQNIYPLLISALERGVKIKLILPAEVTKLIFEEHQQGEEEKIGNIVNSPNIIIKVSEVKTLPFDIIDNSMYFEYLGITTSSCLFVRDREAVTAKISLFNQLWLQAKIYGDSK